MAEVSEKSRISILTWITTAIALYHLIAIAQLPTWFGIFIPAQSHKAISIMSAILLIFWLLPVIGSKHGAGAKSENYRKRVPWYDVLLFLSGAIGVGYVVFNHEAVLDYDFYGTLDAKGIILALMIAIPLLEAIRRSTGIVLPVIILTFVGICIFQKYLPGLLYGRGYPLDRLLFSVYVGESGIFGLPIGVAANIIIVFLIFGALMDAAGASRWFMDLAMALTGWSRGGPAKASVVASAMFGSISGSPAGNSATTGVFTIPLMKQIGYSAPFSGAVEAVASTGGNILPPVMGAIAFVMAEWIDTPYSTIVIAAAVPALLYFLVLFVSVHLQAQKEGIQQLKKDQIPVFSKVFVGGWFYLIPIAVLVYFLVIKALSPGIAAGYTIISVLATSYISRDKTNWLTPKKIMKAFEVAVRRWVAIAAITAAVGIMISALELSGVGIKVSRFILSLSDGNLILTMLLVGFVSLILGMGLDAIPAYITLATLMAPALINLGISDIAAHLFVIYWGLASFFTPPTCIAVFVTSGIADSGVWATGWESVKIGIAVFLIPCAFVLNDGLLMVGAPGHVALAISTAIIGACLLAAAVCGYALARLNAVHRIVLLVGGLLLIGPGLLPPLVGIGVSAIVLVPQYFQKRQSADTVEVS